MTNDKNQTTNVEIVTTGFCFLIFEYLCSRNRAKRKAKINSTVSRMPAKTWYPIALLKISHAHNFYTKYTDFN